MGIDSVFDTRNRYASYGPPEQDDDNFVCKSADSEDSNASHNPEGDSSTAQIRGASPAPNPASNQPDYGSVSLSLSLPFLSLSVSHTKDRAGHDFYGLGASVGVGLAPPVALGRPPADSCATMMVKPPLTQSATSCAAIRSTLGPAWARWRYHQLRRGYGCRVGRRHLGRVSAGFS